MKECSKSIPRRLSDSNFLRKFLVGDGIDIGGRPDPLALYREFFPLLASVRTWDIEDGDAQYLAGEADESYDFVHSSHCLEHLGDPREALENWLRVLKPGGHLVVTVPDEDLYEQGEFPSSFNSDHRWTFTIGKAHSWSNRSVNLIDLLREFMEEASIERLERLTSTYRFELPRYDQTLTPVGEAGIECVLRKLPASERAKGGRLPARAAVDREITTHLNQYRNDLDTLKSANRERPPFENDSDIGD